MNTSTIGNPTNPVNDYSGSISALIDARSRTHGDFDDHARITQQIKNVCYAELTERELRSQDRLTSQQIEALDMIAHKIGRILAGDPCFKDHWDDIAGYAMLAAREADKLSRL